MEFRARECWKSVFLLPLELLVVGEVGRVDRRWHGAQGDASDGTWKEVNELMYMGAAKRRGSILASHPAALSSNPTVPEVSYPEI